ncbi:MAG: PAS domain-containing protein [Candidatus Pacebacteria bacterium]|nr:PAS domain-containing protein [Candidatus Paceibacterota bacterium]
MDSTSVILALCALLNFVLATYILCRRHTRKQHFVFFCLVLAIGFWDLANSAVMTISTEAFLVWAGRMSYVGGASIATLYFIFTWFFPEKTGPSAVSLPRKAMVGLGIGVVMLSLTDYVQTSIEVSGTLRHPVFGSLYPVHVLYSVSAFAWGTWNLLHGRTITTSGKERMQLNYILSGFIIAFIVAFIGTFLMPVYMPSSECLPIAGVASLIFTSMAAYAIVRYRLLDIGVAFRNVLVHGLVALVLVIVVAVPFLMSNFVVPNASLLTQAVIILVVTGALAYALPHVQRQITAFVDHRIFRGRYDHQTALTRFSERIQGTYGHEKVGSIAAREITIIMQGKAGAVYLPASAAQADGQLVFAGGYPPEEDRFPPALSMDNALVTEVWGKQRRLVREDVASGRYRDAVVKSEDLLIALDRLQVAVAVPLISQTQALGLMLLDERQNDNLYSTEDLQLLGALTSQTAVALDNTRLYEEILQSKKQYETMLTHMQRGVVAVDPSLHVLTLNTTGAEILSMQVRTCVGKNIRDLVPAFADIFEASLRQHRNQPPLEVQVKLADRTIPCQCETSIMLDARNQISGALMVFQDLTNQQRFEREVRRIDRLASVGTLAAGIAHEIKNPLVSIQTFAQLLRERHKDAQFRENFGNVVLSEISRINTLVKRLLDFARPKHVQPGPVQVHDIIERALTLLENQFKKQQVEAVCKFGTNIPVIIADPEQLYQVVFNLLQNAVQAMDGDVRCVTISTQKSVLSTRQTEKEAVLLEIKDTGKGIDKDDLSSIFDPFYSTKAEGSGLGLSICHNILKEHGASIDVESTVGVGSRFTITLPVEGGK